MLRLNRIFLLKRGERLLPNWNSLFCATRLSFGLIRWKRKRYFLRRLIYCCFFFLITVMTFRTRTLRTMKEIVIVHVLVNRQIDWSIGHWSTLDFSPIYISAVREIRKRSQPGISTSIRFWGDIKNIFTQLINWTILDNYLFKSGITVMEQ